MIDNQRQIGLIRYCRAHLHNENLISDEEYAWLLTEENPGAVKRLEKYDALRARIAELKEENISIVGMLQQRLQPGGSPPPGGAVQLADWITRSAVERISNLIAERDAAKAEAARVSLANKKIRAIDENGNPTMRWSEIDEMARQAIAQPVLDWLAKVKREAIAEWLDAQAKADNGERADIGPWCREQADALRKEIPHA